MDTEKILSLVSLTLMDSEGVHYHYDPETQEYNSSVGLNTEQLIEFYNQCHDEDGKFCEGLDGPGRARDKAVSGKSDLNDSDGRVVGKSSGKEERGPLGGSLVDPHEGTKEFDGIRGYHPQTGKPVPGTDAWLEAHGIPKDVFETRPYVKFEADKTDPALLEAFQRGTPGAKQWDRLADQEGQEGGYIMYKHPIPDSPYGPIEPQVRPNEGAITNFGKRAQKQARLEQAKQRYKDLKDGKITPAKLQKEQEARVQKAELNLTRMKKATPEIIRAEAQKDVDDATSLYQKAKATKDPELVGQARKDLNSARIEQKKAEYRAAKFKPESSLYHAQKEVDSAKQKLAEIKEDPKAFHAAEILRQGGTDGKGGRIKRADNAFKDTKAKYLFTRGADTSRIDMNPDKQNVKNLTQGKGRIYFAMEGSIKNDAVLAAVKREDPTAAVVNVPSVTLWHNKNATEGEIKWFARTHGKDRQIVLIPDADGVNNVNVMRQAKALAATLKTGGAAQVLVAAPPVKHGTKNIMDPIKLSSTDSKGSPVFDERKGIDDHLGAGRGTLGQLAYQTDAKIPKFSLAKWTREAGNDGEKKLNRNALPNHEAMLGAISSLSGKNGAAQVSMNLLMQTSGITSKGSATAARDKLHDLGIIDVRYVFDKQVLANSRKRVQVMPQKEVDSWVKARIIKPLPDDLYARDDYEASPIIVIKDPKYVVKAVNSTTGVISDLPDWKPPKTYDGWRSPVTGKKDTTGIAARMESEETKSKSKASGGAKVSVAQTAEQRAATKVAPPGRRLVRSKAGAKRYGVAIGQPIPLAGDPGTIFDPGIITSMVLLSSIMSEDEIVEFYNSCHDENGKFCKGTSSGSAKGETMLPSGVETGYWPPRGGRPVTKTYEFEYGPTSGSPKHIDEIGPVKKEYEVTAEDGTTIHLIDKTGFVTDNQADFMLQEQARMHEMYHLEPPRHLVVVHDAEANGAIASVKLGKSDVFTLVNEKYLNVNYFAPFGPPGRKWSMPSAYTVNKPGMVYDLAHEYGHQVDGDKNYNQNTGIYHPNPMTAQAGFRSHLSSYALDKESVVDVEAYAETFAEWHHSEGRTKNPAAIAMARYEGWNGNDQGPFQYESDKSSRSGYYRGTPSSRSRYDESPYYGPGFSVLNMVQVDPETEEFYNQCHDDDGRFCEGEDGAGRLRDKEPVSGDSKVPLKTGGVRKVASAILGSVQVDGVKAKTVYELTNRKGGTHKLFDKTGNVSKEDASLLLWSHARMAELYPLQPPRDIVVTKPKYLFGSSKVDSNSFAAVHGDDHRTYVNSERLGVDVSDFKDGFQMPSAKTGNTKNMHYLMTHEYGHHVDFARNSDNGYSYKVHPLYKVSQQFQSRYGRSDDNGIEGYAEAFAEWHHSAGTTTNPAARAYAQYEGWSGTPGYKRNLSASGGVDVESNETSFRPIEVEGKLVSLTHQALVHFAKDDNVKYFPEDTEDEMNADIPKPEKSVVIYDTFTEGGAIIEGDFERAEPSESEKARAKEIWDQVLKELGLEEDE